MNKINTISKLDAQELSLGELIRSITQRCATIGIELELCEGYAWQLLMHALKISRARLLAQKSIRVTTEQGRWIEQACGRLEKAEPLAYILGSTEFLSLNIQVRPPILIPRSETEQWVAECIEHHQRLQKIPARILDLCTGSGCVALAFARAFPQSQVIAVDDNPEALALAEENRIANALSNVQFVRGDVQNVLDIGNSFDLIVSNPPYVSEEYWNRLDPSVRDWEDKHAIIAQDAGLRCLVSIISLAPRYLENSALHAPELWVEIDFYQVEQVQKLFAASGFNNIQQIHDNSEKVRVIMGELVSTNS